MPLTRLDITDFRNLAAIQLTPLPQGFNILFGQNGSGKTSLLEAIYYLSFGRSFRSHLSSRVVRHCAEKFILFAHSLDKHEQISGIGIERTANGDIKIRLAEKDVISVAELANVLPLQLMNSQSFALLEEGPAFRRKYLDWGIFHLYSEFLLTWREFNQALKQRNAALKMRKPFPEVRVWTEEIVKKGLLLNDFREKYLLDLLPLLTEFAHDFLALETITLSYQAGWDKTISYQEALHESLDKDYLFGYTTQGPHRAELTIKINKINAKDILSRGQQKLFVCAMILAQGALLQRHANKKTIYLIDDLPSELDAISRAKLIALLSKQETQIFVTAVEHDALKEALSERPKKMFHVEHGDIREVFV